MKRTADLQPASRAPLGTPATVGDLRDFPGSHRFLLVAGLLVVSLLLFLLTVSKQPTTFTITTGGLCFLSVVAVLLPFMALRDESILSPLTLLALCVFITMPARFLYLVTANGAKAGVWYDVPVDADDFALAAALVAASLVVFSAVYILARVAFKQLAPRLTVPPGGSPYTGVSVTRFVVIAAVTLVITAVTTIIYIKVIGLDLDDVDTLSKKRAGIATGSLFVWLFYFMMDIPFLLMMVAMLAALGRTRDKMMFWIFVPPFLMFACLFPFLRSARSEFLLLLAVALLGYYVVRRRIPVMLSVVGGCGVLFIFGLMTALRSNALRGSIEKLSFVDLAIEKLAGSFNLGGFAALAYAMEVVPKALPFQNGSTLWSFLETMIPRAFWPAKPEPWGIRWLEAFGVDISTRHGGGALPGLMAEGYLNFGTIGPTVLMVGYAIVLAAFYHFAFLRRRPGLWSCATYLILLPALTNTLYGYGVSKGILDIIRLCVMFGAIMLVLRVAPVVATQAAAFAGRRGGRDAAPPVAGGGTRAGSVAGRWASRGTAPGRATGPVPGGAMTAGAPRAASAFRGGLARRRAAPSG